jgi:2-dehydropantoate 2-reductase
MARMTVALVGLGALGAAHLATILDHAPAADVVVVAGGQRGERLRRDGFTANGRHYPVTVVAPGEAAPADLVLVAVKGYHLGQAIADMAGVVGPGTAIVSLLNGVSSEAALQAAYPDAYVPLAYSILSNAGRDEAGFRFYSVGRIDLGEPRGRPPTGRLEPLTRRLGELGLPYGLPDDIEHAEWAKFLINVGVNQASALLECPYRVIQELDSAPRRLLVGLMGEAVAVSQAAGTGLTEADTAAALAALDQLDPAGYSSMAQDARFHRPMELDLFGGEVLRLAERHGVAAPLNAAALTILEAKQAAW